MVKSAAETMIETAIQDEAISSAASSRGKLKPRPFFKEPEKREEKARLPGMIVRRGLP